MRGDVTLPAWAWIVFSGALVALIVWLVFDNWRMEREHERQFEKRMQAFWKADRERWEGITEMLLRSINASDTDDLDACDICANDRYEYDPADDVWHSPHEVETPD